MSARVIDEAANVFADPSAYAGEAGLHAALTHLRECGPRLQELRLGSFQILIRYVDLSLQSIQLRILKNLPPLTAKVLIIRVGRLPVP